MDSNQIYGSQPANPDTDTQPVQQNTATVADVDSNMTQQSEDTYAEQPQYVYTESWMGASANGARQQGTGFYTQSYAQSPNYGQAAYGMQQNPYTSTQPYQQQNQQFFQNQPYQQSQPYGQQMWNQQNNTAYPAYNPYATPKAPGNGMIGFAIAGMVCGILSIMACAFMVFDLIFVISGLVFSIIAINKKYAGRGMAIAGLICSIAGTILSLSCTFLVLADLL